MTIIKLNLNMNTQTFHDSWLIENSLLKYQVLFRIPYAKDITKMLRFRYELCAKVVGLS